jgi:D-alanyl-D-alanine carboxypeptidase
MIMETKLTWDPSSYLKDWLRFRYEREDIPGFVVAVSQDGKTLLNESYGYADVEAQVKMTPEHVFRIASHSKTFTATAIMQLQEKGKLKIDDPVSDYLPWLKDHKDKRWLNVTIRQLLSHGAGVIRDGLDSDYWQLYRAFPDSNELKQDILKTALILDNNLKMKYSNYGYSVLGYIVESASGKSYNEYVLENIVRDLGLRDTGPELAENIKSRLVTGYSPLDSNKKRLPIDHIDTKAMSPATGFYSTSGDMLKYFNALMIGSGKLLNDESKKEMQRLHWVAENTSEKEEYGLGLEIEYVNKKRVFGHGGGFPGHSTKSLFDPETKTVVIVLTNAMRTSPDKIAHGIIRILNFGKSQNAEQTQDLSKYKGRFMSLWSMVDFVALGDKLICAFSDSWDPFQHPDELEPLDHNDFKIVKTDSFADDGELVHFNFDNEGKSVESVIYGGETLLPEKIYEERMKKTKKKT